MNFLDLKLRVRSLTRDFTNSIFRDVDIKNFINEGIDRFKQVIPELSGLNYLYDDLDVPLPIPDAYHHLLAIYATSRVFGQDERHYQASLYMNEFEVKLDELKMKIESGEEVIIDPETGEPIIRDSQMDYVVNEYFFKKRRR